MSKAIRYCDLCKVNHCSQKATMLFPEDKATWLVYGNDLPIRICDTHKLILEKFADKEVVFVDLRKARGAVPQGKSVGVKWT